MKILIPVLISILLLNSCTEEKTAKRFFFENGAYEDFISSIAHNDSIIIVPLKDFNSTIDSTKIILSLRHDVDDYLESSMQTAEVEYNHNVRATYFILHSAPYYLLNPNDKSKHNPIILGYLHKLQDFYHHEIGLHNDLVTIQLFNKINSREYLSNELSWLRENGIQMYGTASHGAEDCKKYKYLNFYFFKECNNINPSFPNIDSVKVRNKKIAILKGTFLEYDLNYEAYFLNFTKYYTEHGNNWEKGMFHIKEWKKGDRIIILTHPQYWFK